MSGVSTATWIGRELASGRYCVDALLGEGGMGAVYQAWDKNLGTEVVVKVPHAAMLQDAEFAARFAREISALVRLSHPHIVKISDVGEQDGLPFAVMQFLPGGSLEDRQKTGPNGKTRSLAPDSVKAWLPSIAEALDFVHSQGYIHRDVKPANILFDAHGHAYLSDFGIAKSAVTGQANSTKTVTGSGMAIGTPEYMAPELIMGQSCDGRVDQYALAVTVFEMLAGRRPFEDATSTALYVQHATAEPPNLTTLSPDISPAIAAAIHRALSKSPEQRFASCRAFATVLLGAAETFTASQSEAVDTKCPVCQSSLKLADRMRGKQLRCAGCHSLLHVSDDLQLMPVLSSANETVARATTRLASGTRGQAIISAVEADNSYRLQRDQDSQNKGSEPVPAKSSASATQRAASLGEPTSRSMSGKTIRPSMLPSPKTKSPANQHERQGSAESSMFLIGKLLRQIKGDFQAFARRHPTLIATVVWVLVLASIPPLMLYVFKEKERDDNSVPTKLESDSSATTREPQPADVNHPPRPSPASVQPSIAEPQTLETIPSEKPTEDPNRLISKSTGMEFVLIPAGEFMMGSSDADVTAAVNALAKEKIDRINLAGQQPQHRVLITKAFYMSTHETTQAQYEQIIGTNPSGFSASGKYSKQVSGQNTSRFPVENVSWFDAVEFCNKLSEQESRTPCYRLTSIERSDGSIKSASVAILRGHGYRLPTEAEWEYACRAKSTTPFHFGSWLNGEDANVNGNYPFGTTTKGPFKDRTTVVGSYSANAFGLYDMHGNAWEWCQDGYDENYYAQRVERDPPGATRNDLRVLRGGSWAYDCRGARSAYRGAVTPDRRGNGNVGFRVVCVSASGRPKQLDTPAEPAKPPKPDPVKTSLEQARAAYEARLRSAKKVLLDRHSVLMNAASKTGNPAKAKTIQTWRDAFERDGWFAIPVAEIKEDILEYGRVTHGARQAFLSAYEDAIAARKKAGEMDRASQLQNEKSELRLASRLVSLQCYRQSGVFIQHANLKAVTPHVSDGLNATLEMVPGLSDQSHVSFRSVNLPDHYLTHGDFQFVFRKLNAADPTFLRNSTFKRQSPLVQGAGNLAVSYEAVTHAGFFIRARNGALRLERTNGSTQFRSEATFIVTDPQFPIWND
ncbi:MAG: SUMF1/EgtB/PvdO family nonheme iron enzyme [Planctomycetaceae bacterium]